MASALGAGLILAGEAVVSGFYNWRMRDHLLVSGLLMAGGLLLGLLLHARLMSLNSRAGRSSELTSMGNDLCLGEFKTAVRRLNLALHQEPRSRRPHRLERGCALEDAREAYAAR